MSHKLNKIQQKFKEFLPTSWSIDNTTTMYIITMMLTGFGTISVTTVYVGNSPNDIENLVTRPIEKQIKGISGAKVNKINSISQTDFSLIIVEFDTDIKPEIAKQKVKDAV